MRIFLAIYLSIDRLSTYLSICLSFVLSICLPVDLSMVPKPSPRELPSPEFGGRPCYICIYIYICMLINLFVSRHMLNTHTHIYIYIYVYTFCILYISFCLVGIGYSLVVTTRTTREDSYSVVRPSRIAKQEREVYAYRLLSTSFLGLPYRILNMNHKKELRRSLWVTRLY